MQVVGPVGDHDHDRRDECADEQEAEHLPGGLVGPVRVLHDQQQRGPLRGRLQQGVHGLEEVRTVEADCRGVPLLAVGPRQHPPSGLEPLHGGVGLQDRRDDLVRQLVDQPADHLGERQVRQRTVAEVDTVPDGDGPAPGPSRVGQLAEQPGLADAGVAVQEQGMRGAVRLTRPVEQGHKPRRLGVPADEPRVRHLRSRHAVHDLSPRRQR